ncbi:MAG: hypothetical protein RIQ89_604 [Bacteroidota bacterium]
MKHFLLLLFLVSSSRIVHSQQFELAYSCSTEARSRPSAIIIDQYQNIYLSHNTDSVSTPHHTTISKYQSMTNNLLWQHTIAGQIRITDMEFNLQGSIYCIGYFKNTVIIDTTQLTATAGQSKGLVIKIDSAGSITMVSTITLSGAIEFEPVDLFISPSDQYYFTALTSGTGSFCSFHQMSATGQIIKSELAQNQVRSFSKIVADTNGNVYLSGTCSNFAQFDSFNSNPNFSYQNFLVKYDSSFTAQWLINKEYITFDEESKLKLFSHQLFWGINDFTNNADTTKIIRLQLDGTIISELHSPLNITFFPSFHFDIDPSGTTTWVLNSFIRFFIYRYDANGQFIHQDTVLSQLSANGKEFHVTSTNNGYYITGTYMNDTLPFDSIMVYNPNSSNNYPSDIFIAKWHDQSTGLWTPAKEPYQLLYDPINNSLSLLLEKKQGGIAHCYNATGQLRSVIPCQNGEVKLTTTEYKAGIYFLQLVLNNGSVLKIKLLL